MRGATSSSRHKSESPAGWTVPTNAASIVASDTPGSPGTGNSLTIVGGQIDNHGVLLGGSSVIQLYYIDHCAFQFNGTDWYGPITSGGTGALPLTSPLPTTSLSNSSLSAGQPSGTVVGTLSTTTGLPSGTIGTGAYTWTYTLTGAGSGNFAISGSNLQTAIANLSGGPYSFTVRATNAAVSGGAFFTLSVTIAIGTGFVATPIDGTYALTFDEEFNGSAYDSNVWWNQLNTTWYNANSGTTPANVTVSGSAAILALTLRTPGNFTSYDGVLMFTKTAVADGNAGNWYIEARCRLPAPNNTGFWPAFWLNHFPDGTFPEVDINEWYGNQPNNLPATYHDPGGIAVGGSPDVGLGNLGNSYHVYGFLWTPSVLTWYVDGVVFFTMNNGANGASISTGPYQCLLQINANGFDPANTMSATTNLPGLFKVDYVHVYQKGAVAITPQANYGGAGSTAGPTS